MQKKCKILTFSFVLVILLISFTCFATIWYVDPLKLIHKPFMCKDTSYDNVNFVVKNLIDNEDYDSIILGTSLLSNTSAKEANKVFGGKFLNVSIWGTLTNEKITILDYISKNKKINTVIMSLDQGSKPLAENNFISLNKEVISTYNFTIFNTLKIYLQDKHLKHIFNFSCETTKINKDTPTTWTYNESISNRLGSFEKWASINIVQVVNINNTLKDATEKISKEEFSYLDYDFNKEYLDKNLLDVFRKYPDTQFILIIPPYFIAQNAIYFQVYKNFENAQKSSLFYLIKQKPSNVKIYGFDDMGFVSDVANYYDLIHFSPKISSDILGFVKNDIGLLEEKNFEQYWSKFANKSREFNLKDFYEKFLAQANKKDKKKDINAKKI